MSRHWRPQRELRQSRYQRHLRAGYLFPRGVPRPYVEMMSAAVVGSVAAAAVRSFPGGTNVLSNQSIERR